MKKLGIFFVSILFVVISYSSLKADGGLSLMLIGNTSIDYLQNNSLTINAFVQGSYQDTSAQCWDLELGLNQWWSLIDLTVINAPGSLNNVVYNFGNHNGRTFSCGADPGSFDYGSPDKQDMAFNRDVSDIPEGLYTISLRARDSSPSSTNKNVDIHISRIYVNSNRADASWNISGPVNFSGSGLTGVHGLALPGDYSIAPADISGCSKSVDSTPQSLVAGNRITFNITYSCGGGEPATINVNSNINSSWTIDGPAGNDFTGSGTSSSNTGSAGDYTIYPAAQTCYDLSMSPNNDTQNVSAGGTIEWGLTYDAHQRGDCAPPPGPVYGCTDSNATNYNSSATVDNGSCTYPPGPVYGCTDSNATNYNSSATVDDGSCTYAVYGCTNSNATNYNSSATVDDGSCTYACSGSPPSQSCSSSANACGQTSTGTQSQTCNTNNYTWTGGWTACTASVPPTPAPVACTGSTSSANACGQTSPGGAGTIQCYGTASQTSCSGINATPPPNTCTSSAVISASPNPVDHNTASTLTWSSSNTVANSCSISGLVSGGATSGSVSTGNLTTATSYTLTCTGLDGSPKTASVTVYVKPTVTFQFNPNQIDYYAYTTATWSSTNTTSCAFSWPILPPTTNGSGQYGPLVQSTTITLTCTGPGGTASDTDTVTVGPAPVMNYFRCNGVNTNGTCTIDYGGTAGITWSSSNTTACSLVSTVPTDDLVAGSGSRNDTGITADRDYSIECWDGNTGAHAPALPMPLHVVVNGPAADIKANSSDGPITVAWNGSATISWSSTNATSCTVSPTGWTGTSGSQSTGALTIPGSYTYVLTCLGNGSSSDSVTVNVSNPIPTAYSATYSGPDYCQSGPGGYIAWSYSDPSGSPQASYQIQIDDQGSFQSNEYDSGQLNSSSKVFTIPNGALQFNNGYKARVRAWNTYGGVSDWTVTGTFNTPNYAYPDVKPPYQFTWPALPKPQQNKVLQFTDHTVFGGGNVNNRSWSWNFGDGTTSTQQSPSHTFTTIGNYTITQTVTDAANQTCTYSQSINVQKPIPVIKEVAPK